MQMRSNKVFHVSQFPAAQKLESYTLQRLVKSVVCVAQCFAILPVNGITQDAKSLEFKWTSIRTVYTIFMIILEAAYVLVILTYSIIKSENFLSFVSVVWHVQALTGLIIFLNLARKWPALIKQWTQMETVMLEYGPVRGVKQRFQIISLVFLVTGIAEHAMFVCNSINLVNAVKKENESVFRKYIEIVYQEFFYFYEFSYWKVVPLELLTLVNTFLWQFCNLLVVLLSIALAERFRQVSTKIIKKEIMNEAEWRNLRKHYNTLSLLCKLLNETMAEVFILSCSGNVFFLAISVFQSLMLRTGYAAYFLFYRTVFYIFHIKMVCLYAAWVHEESLAPLSDISSLPVQCISHETERIMNQISTRNIAICGGGFFKVTRSMLLNMVSVIVTIQLILYQFGAKFSSQTMP